MAYGLDLGLFAGSATALGSENSPAAPALKSASRAWHILDEDRRLALVEKALAAGNDNLDGYPVAL
jgi:hypothetical protein